MFSTVVAILCVLSLYVILSHRVDTRLVCLNQVWIHILFIELLAKPQSHSRLGLLLISEATPSSSGHSTVSAPYVSDHYHTVFVLWRYGIAIGVISALWAVTLTFDGSEQLGVAT